MSTQKMGKWVRSLKCDIENRMWKKRESKEEKRGKDFKKTKYLPFFFSSVRLFSFMKSTPFFPSSNPVAL